jgi:hypothetical protein
VLSVGPAAFDALFKFLAPTDRWPLLVHVLGSPIARRAKPVNNVLAVRTMADDTGVERAAPTQSWDWPSLMRTEDLVDVRSSFHVTIKHVVQVGSDEQMIRAHAQRRVAVMQDVQSVRRIVAMCEFPDESMGVLVALQVAVPEIPIAVVGCSLPEPALPRGIDFRPEALGQRHSDSIGIVGQIV